MGTFSKESGEGGAALHKDHPLLVGGRGARKHGASGSLRYHSRDQCQQVKSLASVFGYGDVISIGCCISMGYC